LPYIIFPKKRFDGICNNKNIRKYWKCKIRIEILDTVVEVNDKGSGCDLKWSQMLRPGKHGFSPGHFFWKLCWEIIWEHTFLRIKFPSHELRSKNWLVRLLWYTDLIIICLDLYQLFLFRPRYGVFSGLIVHLYIWQCGVYLYYTLFMSIICSVTTNLFISTMCKNPTSLWNCQISIW